MNLDPIRLARQLCNGAMREAREQAFRALQGLGRRASSAAGILCEALAHPDRDRRRWAAVVLGGSGSDAVEPLLAVLGRDDPELPSELPAEIAERWLDHDGWNDGSWMLGASASHPLELHGPDPWTTPSLDPDQAFEPDPRDPWNPVQRAAWDREHAPRSLRMRVWAQPLRDAGRAAEARALACWALGEIGPTRDPDLNQRVRQGLEQRTCDRWLMVRAYARAALGRF